jgi:hypothetical protein
MSAFQMLPASVLQLRGIRVSFSFMKICTNSTCIELCSTYVSTVFTDVPFANCYRPHVVHLLQPQRINTKRRLVALLWITNVAKWRLFSGVGRHMFCNRGNNLSLNHKVSKYTERILVHVFMLTMFVCYVRNSIRSLKLWSRNKCTECKVYVRAPLSDFQQKVISKISFEIAVDITKTRLCTMQVGRK